MQESSNCLYTWGYQGRTLQELKSLIKIHNIGLVADVRQIPWSHNPAFRQETLTAELNSIIPFLSDRPYQWMPSLGNQHRALPWKPRFDWQEGVNFLAGLLIAEQRVVSYNVLLMCMEQNPEHCHRADVAKKVQNVCHCSIHHLGWEEPIHQLGLFCGEAR